MSDEDKLEPYLERYVREMEERAISQSGRAKVDRLRAAQRNGMAIYAGAGGEVVVRHEGVYYSVPMRIGGWAYRRPWKGDPGSLEGELPTVGFALEAAELLGLPI
jgi:hypothetical protein